MTLFFVLEVRDHVQDPVDVQQEISIFQAFVDAVDLPPLPPIPPLLIIPTWSCLASSERVRMVVVCVTMVEAFWS